ncbi:FecR family protein [Pedobacter namyangjuensis]|uniref:FecR family protein n=1 Tax=Pedobacter namyangjuensis TaxID=600626 RepID=UPI000DE3EB50|nr:FecR family protein [Pedobacter namyangjuensis]
MSIPNSRRDFQQIIENYVSGKATPEEIAFIEAYYAKLENQPDVLDEFTSADSVEFAKINFEAIQTKIKKAERKPRSFYKYAVAAVLFLSLGMTVFYTLRKDIISKPVAEQTVAKKIDVDPGSDKATLTLADGSTIVLDNTNTAEVFHKNGLIISKTKSGELIYKIENASSTKPNAYNTITTPKGGQYQVLLPDGTKVWLNAASSLKYPEVLGKTERMVTLTGEAYFEVAKDGRPFYVNSKQQSVKVLGTHFNVNTYMDDNFSKTTLLEGSIALNTSKNSKIIKPGQQALIGVNSLIAIDKDVDVQNVVAWKNGLFVFDNAGLKSILNQLERWYDIKIDYSDIPNKRYNGMVPRKAKLSEVLNMLELTGNINFKIEEGRTLKVFNK